MKQFIRPEIEINDPSYEWTGQIRIVRHGEAYCGIDGIVREWCHSYFSDNKHFVLRKQFVVPNFVPPGWWIAIDEDGKVWIYQQRPTFVFQEWTIGYSLDQIGRTELELPKEYITAHGVTLPDVRGEKAIWQREVSNG